MAKKWEFNSVYLRNKKKRISFRLTGRRSASRPTAEAGLARVPACRVHLASAQPTPFPCLPLAHAPTAAEHARRVAAMRRRRRRASQPACARAHAPAYFCWSRCARWLTPALPLLSASTERPHSPSRRAIAPAGKIRRVSSTSARDRAPTAPPRSPARRAHACAAC